MSSPKPGQWYPPLSPKQAETVNCDKRFILCHGPRYGGKTIGLLHFVAKHLWTVDGARVGMFAKTIKSASHSGTYRDLIDERAGVLSCWFNSGIGMHYTVPPKIDGATRTHHFKVNNMHGGESELYLYSIEHEQETQEKVKNLRFSLIWFIELSNFDDDVVFNGTIPQLRMPGIPYENHHWIADTNPSDEGQDSWIYKLFIDPEEPKTPEEKEFRNQFAEFLFVPEENPFLDPREFETLKQAYSKNPDLYSRDILGKWVHNTSKGHFVKVFNEERHVIGRCEGARENWEVLLPSENCRELLTGWDLGDVSHSFHVIEKIMTVRGAVYAVLDELYCVEENVAMSDFTAAAFDKIKMWDEQAQALTGVRPTWRHWSDSAATSHFRSAADSYDANLVFKETDGQVSLLPSPKGAHSVSRRVNILRILFQQNRLFISASCFGTIEMVKNCRKGNNASANYVRRDKYKHRFDSLSYAVGAEEPIELINDMVPKTGGLNTTIHQIG